MIFFLMSFNFSNIERTRNCIFGRSTNWDNLSQGQSDINAIKSQRNRDTKREREKQREREILINVRAPGLRYRASTRYLESVR